MSCPLPFVRDPAAFEAGLAAVPGAAAEAGVREISALPTGGVNASFRVVTAHGEFVLRLADVGPRTALLGVDRQRERVLHELAADAGLAPPVLARAGDGRWHVRPFVRGVHWSGGDFDSPRQIERLGAALRRLQSIPAPQFAPFDPFTTLSRWGQTLAQRSPVEATTLCSELDGARAALARIDAARRAPCVVHSDLHGENILDGEGLCFIDWEYAQVADPLCEIGSLLAAHPQLDRHSDALLAAAGLADRASRDELTGWATVYRCLNSFWRRLAWEP
jgi:aminoglycoside phosphotransferase (APT) family kinase protein